MRATTLLPTISLATLLAAPAAAERLIQTPDAIPGQYIVRLQEGANGAGLGLPAARSIARAHGGDIVILDGEKGALLRVTLPG